MLLAAGCQPVGNSAQIADTPRATAATQSVDVEAPDVFRAEAQGLWDGRPSLGGTWVAYPGVATPERVVIRNTETGKSVNGALFRRERENPGPPFQVSSDAADALGMLAGAPAPLIVTALRREAPDPAEVSTDTVTTETLADDEG
ncbi:sporulation domain-containing protein [Oceaniovalibus guishaninsula JLT2003]|uniref:Sporulation domain-containing protein n=1 Tax=Oceaniovalibus guishaninsula JLT2003 TaxID=1231392 RepID=K2I8P4_9RHOB|nr:sporulation domain-containing protein [Oceaniovalibus guishaninsula JLT2003]